MTTDITKLEESASKQKEKSRQFSDLLDTIISLEDKKKILWQQIYDNAVQDRENGNILFTDLYLATQGRPAEHQLNGPVMAKYIERMSRANDQLIKLSELLQLAQEKETALDENDIFDQIAGKK